MRLSPTAYTDRDQYDAPLAVHRSVVIRTTIRCAVVIRRCDDNDDNNADAPTPRVFAPETAESVTVERYEYDPYGERTAYISPGSNDPDCHAPTLLPQRVKVGGIDQPYAICEFGHQGLMHDDNTGLIYNRARVLHPRFRRFMQRDPIEYSDGSNLYEYVQSSPHLNVDPEGRYAHRMRMQGHMEIGVAMLRVSPTGTTLGVAGSTQISGTRYDESDVSGALTGQAAYRFATFHRYPGISRGGQDFDLVVRVLVTGTLSTDVSKALNGVCWEVTITSTVQMVLLRGAPNGVQRRINWKPSPLLYNRTLTTLTATWTNCPTDMRGWTKEGYAGFLWSSPGVFRQSPISWVEGTKTINGLVDLTISPVWVKSTMHCAAPRPAGASNAQTGDN